jgi:hypothetical protein
MRDERGICPCCATEALSNLTLPMSIGRLLTADDFVRLPSGLSLSQYFAALRAALVGCLVMAASVLLVRRGLPYSWSRAARLGAEVGIGALVFAVVLLVFRVTVIYRVTIDRLAARRR